MKRKIFDIICFLVILILVQVNIYPQRTVKVADLRGMWKFSIGDEKKWSQPNYDDANWDEIGVPGAWEEQGYHGYDGYAWYRKKVYISSQFASRYLVFKIGRIDDVDEVYINGKMIAKTGALLPVYKSAYSEYREYRIPNTIVKFNAWNTIAIRVFDGELAGGIVEGEVSIFAQEYFLYPLMSLESEWKFNTGDNAEWKEPGFNDSKWDAIMVPCCWEKQGYPDYDGYAWYRKKFVPSDALKDNKLVLMVGKIDDFDEVFINGVKIGSTGKVDDPRAKTDNYSYKQLRGYYVPDGLIKFNKENVIAVRVLDVYRDGGIYQGPVGFVTQKQYAQFWRAIKKSYNKNSGESFFTW